MAALVRAATYAAAPDAAWRTTMMSGCIASSVRFTVRGRLGLAVTPGLLVYGTGGLAYGDVKSNVLINQQIVTALVCSVCGPYSLNAGAQETRIGYAVGAGAEWMIASHWSAKIEYLYYDLGKVSGSGPSPCRLAGAGSATSAV